MENGSAVEVRSRSWIAPTRGVDIGVKQSMYQLMMELKKRGKSNPADQRGASGTAGNERQASDYERRKHYR